MKDQNETFKNYSVKIPKEEINKMVLKELNKLYPDYVELTNLRKKIYKLERELSEIDDAVRAGQET